MGEVQFELRSYFLGGRVVLPNETVFNKEVIIESQLVRRVQDLKGGVWGTICVGKIYSVLNLTE